MLVALAVLLDGMLQGANATGSCDLQDGLLVGVSQNCAGVVVVAAFKYIVRHFVFLLVIGFIVIIIIGATCEANDCVHGVLLVSVQLLHSSVEYFLEGLFLFHFSFLLGIFAIIVRLIITCVSEDVQRNIAVSINDRLFVGAIIMLDDTVDEGAGVGTRYDQTHLTNLAVHDVVALLTKLIRVDGQCFDITMLDCFLRSLACLGIIELTVCVHTFSPVFQNGMAQYMVNIVVLVAPH